MTLYSRNEVNCINGDRTLTTRDIAACTFFRAGVFVKVKSPILKYYGYCVSGINANSAFKVGFKINLRLYLNKKIPFYTFKRTDYVLHY